MEAHAPWPAPYLVSRSQWESAGFIADPRFRWGRSVGAAIHLRSGLIFPRYLFVGATDDKSWAPVRSTVGVASLVRFGGRVAEVSLKLIEGLRNAAEEPQAARPLYKQGQKVRIVTWDYATLEAVFDLVEGEERATVLLELLGRQRRVRVGVGEIVNAD